MSKRFVDTELWQKEWFQDLPLIEKVLVKYVFENCDCAGIWNANYKLASFIIGEPVTIQNIENINAKKKQFEVLENGNIFIIDFIKFQYGELSEKCKPHQKVITILKNNNLLLRVSKGYPKGIQTLEEKEEEQYKEKEEEKEEEITQNLFGEYQNVCLSEEQHSQLLAMCMSNELLNELLNSLSRNIEVGKERPYIADLPNAHYERLKSYYNFRRRNPQRFVERGSETKTITHSNQDALRRAMEKWVNKQEEAL